MESDNFEYSYSAKQQEEIEAIRKKYVPRIASTESENKLEQLRRLDRKAESKATMAAIILGVIGTLVFGTGMSLILALDNCILSGSLVGVLGVSGIALALPAYRVVLKKERERIAPQVLQLSEELLK